MVIHSNNLKSYFGSGESINIVAFIENSIGEGLARIAVPSFFIISGFLFFKGMVPSTKTFLAKYKTRAKSLVVPYLLWNLIGYVYWCIVPRLAKGLMNAPPANISFKSLVIAVITAQYEPFWFIKFLIICIIVSPIIFLIVNKPILSECYICILLILWISQSGSSDIWVAFFFFSIGAYISVRKPSIMDMRANNSSTCIMIICLIIALCINAYLFPEGIIKVVILIGIPTLWIVYDIFEKHIKVSKFMKYSFFIYATHSFIIFPIEKLILKFLGKGQIQALFNYIITPLIAVVIIIIVANFIKSYIPQLRLLLNGGR